MRAAALIALITLFAYAAAAEQPASAVDEPVGLVVYTALGDSVTWQNQYVAEYAAHTEADLHTSVALTNLGQPGWMSPTLLTALQTNQAFQGAVASADLITIFIGLNDYQWMRAQYLDPGSPWCQPKETCMQAMVDNFHANLGAIIAEIRSLNGSSDAAIRMMTIYNPYVAQDAAAGNFDYFDGFLQQMNAAIEAEAA